MKVSEQTVASDVLRAYAEIVGKNPDKKYELINNEIIEMAGGSLEHSHIAVKVLFFLMQQLDEDKYLFFNSDLGIALAQEAFRAYPDGSMCVGEPECVSIRGMDYLTNPCLILEVLSDSTKARDRNEKRAAYQQLPALQTYLLAAQDAPRVERYEREAETWRHEVFEGLDAAFTVLNGAAELRLADLYRGVNFGNQ